MTPYNQPKKSDDPLISFIDWLLSSIWQLIKLPFRGYLKQSKTEQVRREIATHMAKIEAEGKAGQWRDAILAADILLDQALRHRAVSGQTLGERLKSATTILSTNVLNRAWSAHKIRNRIAHELNYQPSVSESQQSINDFKATIRELGLL